MTTDAAETVALKALGFMAESPEAMHRMMEISGLDAATLRKRAAEPDFLSFVLQYLLGEEPLLTAFCERESLAPREVHLAQHALGGA